MNYGFGFFLTALEELERARVDQIKDMASAIGLAFSNEKL